MRFARGRLACFCLLAGQSLYSPLDPKLSDAVRAIEQRIADSHGDVAVVFRTLDGQTTYSFRPDVSFHAASTMKIPVMIELFEQVKDGKLRLEDPLVIRNEFHSIVDGSPYQLDPADDSETGLYKVEGQTRTLSQLCELMITTSSNLAANLLIEKLGVKNIQLTVHSLGADGMKVLRGVEDGKAFQKGLNSTTTARALALLLTDMVTGKAVDPVADKQMTGILERQHIQGGIPAGLPPGMRVAHKTGDITKIHHDAAIVYAPKPFVLVILVGGLGEPEENFALMADITRMLYQATQ